MAAALHSVRIADERFWRKVEKTHGCWLWTGARLTKGYGLVRRDTVGILAHRYSWILAHGAIPENMDVCHHCDNPQCVRPDHLFVGTRKANMEDKLTEQRVREIRNLAAQGIGPTEIARRFGIEMRHASLVIRRKRWAHVA